MGVIGTVTVIITHMIELITPPYTYPSLEKSMNLQVNSASCHHALEVYAEEVHLCT